MFEIITEPDFAFGGRDLSLYTSTFYCRTEHGSFPDDEWRDLTSYLPKLWVETICNCYRGIFELIFMCGSSIIRGNRYGNQYELEFLYDNRAMLPSVVISVDELKRQMDKMIRHLRSNLYLCGYETEAEKWDEVIIRLSKLQ